MRATIEKQKKKMNTIGELTPEQKAELAPRDVAIISGKVRGKQAMRK